MPNSRSQTQQVVADFLPIVAIVMLGAALSISAFIAVRAHYIAADKQRFQRDVAFYSSNFKSDVNRHVSSLAAFHAFVSSTHEVTRWEFSAFANEILPQNVGFKAVLWVPHISQRQRQAFESDLQRDGLYGLRLREPTRGGQLVSAGSRATYLPVAFGEPFAGAGSLIGVDLSQEPTYQSLFQAAEQTGQVVASKPTALPSVENGQAPNILLALPLERKQGRRNREAPDGLEGYVLGILQLNRIATESIGPRASIQASISYESRPLAAAPISGWWQQVRSVFQQSHDGEFSQQVPFDIGGQRFSLVLNSLSYSDPNLRLYVPLGAALFLMVITALLLQSMITVTMRKRKVERAVIRRTAQLHSVNMVLTEEVNQRRQAEAALRIAKNKAESANRAKSAFLSTMSHELRTPLNAIIGFSGILAGKKAASEECSEDYANEIHESGIRLLDLINDMLDITQMDAEHVHAGEFVFVSDIVDAAIAKIRPLAELSGVSLQNAILDQLPLLCGDGKRLQRALFHLLSNAIKFTNRGGWARVSASYGPGGLILEVSDNGIGMPVGAETQIADYFSQFDNSLTRRHEGIGLGLTFVRRVADCHNAVLRIASELGGGTHVSLAFPTHRIVNAQEVA